VRENRTHGWNGGLGCCGLASSTRPSNQALPMNDLERNRILSLGTDPAEAVPGMADAVVRGDLTLSR